MALSLEEDALHAHDVVVEASVAAVMAGAQAMPLWHSFVPPAQCHDPKQEHKTVMHDEQWDRAAAAVVIQAGYMVWCARGLHRDVGGAHR